MNVDIDAIVEAVKRDFEAKQKQGESKEFSLEDIVDTVRTQTRKEEARIKRAAEKRKRESDLRNTKLLLRNYHSFRQYAAEHENDDFKEEETPIKELILNGQDIVSSIRMTTKRTIVMVRHMDNALRAFQYMCELEERYFKPTSRHYDILHKRFIEQKSIEEIAEEYGVNDRTVYKLIDSAAERLSILLFGVYGLKIE